MQNKKAVIHGYSYLNDSLRMKYTNAVKANFKSMTNYVQTIDMMKNGRIDYLMMSMIKGRMPEDLKSEFNHVILYQYEANHMVHRRHEYLVDQLSEALEKNLQKLQLTDLQK